ncbi:hypothetical protein LAZ67_11001924 [Cordylochernes scorpioides]|uniref:DUF5641 domain-containing protein n=1 Tax=Cordylochernes scorpioides TaxID=51811 RepID=A0ABY6KYS8_9ARAC|nr:hypothetical protein LAZ67_11001924 [Cordylochernes scorpioides]
MEVYSTRNAIFWRSLGSAYKVSKKVSVFNPELESPQAHDASNSPEILADRFWIKRTKDYIPKLPTRSKWRERTEPIRIGDPVFFVDEQHSRNMWKCGFISDVLLGKYEQVRMVKVTTKGGSKEVI